MNRHLPGLMAACSVFAFLAIGITAMPEPAHAQFGGIAGMIIGHMNGGRYYGGGCRHCGRSGHSGDSSSDDSDSGSRRDRSDSRTADLQPPSSQVENSLLRMVAQLNPDSLGGNGLGDDGTSKAISPLGKANSREGERDWTQKVQQILKKFHDRQTDEGRGVTTAGDVTEHAIEQSLDAAIKSAKLDTFETFLGENWSGERIRVMILDRVWADVDTLFGGNSRGYAPMQEVDKMIQHAAQQTYRRIFEVSELLAANHSSALFTQRLFQTHGGLVNDQLREATDDMIMHASNNAIGKFEAGLRQDANGFALRYRAQRIVFDCLSENVEKISSSETGIATTGEIQQKIETTGKTACVAWLDHQFGGDTRSLVAQKPMPQRVVWSESGPKDDPSMYGRATDGD
jgi:hypothetical protein